MVLTVIIALVATVITVGEAGVTPARAADASEFDPGLIISDANFYDGTALTAGEAQTFLAARGASCTGGSVACLKNYRVTHTAIAASAHCSAIKAVTNQLASAAIVDVGRACDISPKVLIVLLEKEQALVTTRSPTTSRYEYATGLNCPDTAPCDPSAGGFFNQVFGAAYQFQVYRTNPTSFNYRAGRVNSIQYSPTASCGTRSVYIENAATAGLYDYTPYVPNAAALANLYGVGDSCSAYGNRNFWRLYTDWFGDPVGPPLQCPSFEACTTGWSFGGAQTHAVYSGAANAHSGTGYLDVVPQKGATASLTQTVHVSSAFSDSYEGSIWVRARGVSSTRASGKLVIWGLGGSGTESKVVPFKVGTSWTQLSGLLQVLKGSHTDIRFQLYLTTPGVHIDFDDAALQLAPSQPVSTTVALKSPSFEKSLSGWTIDSGVHYGYRTKSAAIPAPAGSTYLATNAAVGGRTIYQDVPWDVDTTTSYTASLWVRSGTKGSVTAKLALWALGGSGTTGTYTSFVAGQTWTKVSVTLPTADATDQSKLRVQLYLAKGLNVLIDGAQLSTNLLPNPSFEGNSVADWTIGSGTTNQALLRSAQNSSVPTSVDGRYLDNVNVVTGKSSGSIRTDVTRTLGTGDTYTAAISVRSNSSFKGKLVIWELGASSRSTVRTFVAGKTWKQVVVSHKIADAANTRIRVQVYLDTTTAGAQLFLDGALLR